mgnify:CR=1 FL=1|jgi:hypothetical protein
MGKQEGDMCLADVMTKIVRSVSLFFDKRLLKK